MVVGRLLSYWEGNFSGAVLNFGRVSHLSKAPHSKSITLQWTNTRHEICGESELRAQQIHPKIIQFFSIKLRQELCQPFFPYIYVKSTFQTVYVCPTKSGNMNHVPIWPTQSCLVCLDQKTIQSHSTNTWKFIATWSPQVSKQESAASKTTPLVVVFWCEVSLPKDSPRKLLHVDVDVCYSRNHVE